MDERKKEIAGRFGREVMDIVHTIPDENLDLVRQAAKMRVSKDGDDMNLLAELYSVVMSVFIILIEENKIIYKENK